LHTHMGGGALTLFGRGHNAPSLRKYSSLFVSEL
jgi:hypothetical protein